MTQDTAGNLIIEPIANCRCGITSGCWHCNPNGETGFIGILDDEEAEEMKRKVKNYKDRFNKDFRKYENPAINQMCGITRDEI